MMGLGDIYEAQDKWEEAVAMYEKAIVVQVLVLCDRLIAAQTLTFVKSLTWRRLT